MSSFLGELKRRRVFKVAVTYGIVAWLLIEVTTTVLPTFEAPEWIAQVFTFFIILGFPVALVLSWAYDLTPHGIERTGVAPESDAQSGAATKSKGAGPKLEYAVIGTLALALVFVLFNRYAPDDESASVDAGEGAATSVIEPSGPVENAVPSPNLLPNSVAVLPFENLSPDPDNAYFAAGIHEEVLNQLAKIRSLNIIARTTMLQYAARDRSIPEIAAELNVETVMEGSVRYADGRVLITAQLIDPLTNAHLWSESYNREFADIFAIQADVAMSIANALEAEFSVAEQERIEKLPTESLEAYSFYLRAMQADSVFGSEMENYLGEAIELDPQFALALGTRAWLLGLWINFASYGAEIVTEWERQVREDAERALSIDPELSVAHVAMAILNHSSWRAVESRSGYERALTLRPNDPTALIWYGALEAHLGDVDEALDKIQRGLTLDPGNFVGNIFLGNLHFAARNYDEASAAFREALRIAPTGPYPILMTAFIAIHRGDNEEALDALKLAESFLADSVFLLSDIALAYSQAGAPHEAQRLFATLEERDELADNSVSSAGWAVAYMAIGDYDEALTRLTESIDNNESGAYDQLNKIQSNFFDDPVLESDPRFLEQRARLQFDL